MSTDALLKEIVSNWDYYRTAWREVYEEAELDMRYQTQGPWTEDELQARKGRVTLWLDQMGQYTNQICNEFRMKPRGVKVNPRGEGASDETARIRGGIIREIEYQSRASQAYITAGESMVERSFGFFKLVTDFEPGSFRRVIRVVAVPNPHVIYIDPDYKEPDASDCEGAFEVERMTERQFKKRFGEKTEIKSFTDEHVAVAPLWVSGGEGQRMIQVAKYWKRVTKANPIYLLDNGQEVSSRDIPGMEVVKTAAEDVQVEDGRVFRSKKALMLDGAVYRVIDERPDNDYEVVEYLTNGLEILEEAPSDFTEIPIIPMFGKVKWVAHGGTSKRVIESAVRKARDAAKAYCYAGSAMAERLAMDPKTPYEGYEGQFATQTFEAGNDINKIPQGYAEFKAVTEATGDTILPLPKRTLTEPQINQYEVASEKYRRDIQSSMGGSPLPTTAQRQNQKSGVALATIEQSNDQGNFHFIDNYDRALQRAGRMMDQALDKVYDTPREVGMRDEGGEYSTGQINQVDAAGNPVGFHTAHGDHGVTISTGPSSQSQRDEADKFLDALSANEAVFPRVADLVVKMKNLGPIGDKIAERLAPPDAQGAGPEIAAAQQQIQAMQAEIEDLKRGDAIKKYVCDESEKTKRVLGLLKVDQQDAENLLEKMLGVLGEHQQRFHEMSMKLHDAEQAARMAEQQPMEEETVPA